MDAHIDLKKIKLIVFDVDGTLLGSTHQITDKTRSIIQKIKQQNISITLATGRNWCETKGYARDLAVDGPLILCNGAVITSIDGSEIKKRLFPNEVIDSLIQTSQKHDISMIFFIDNDVYIKHGRRNKPFNFNYALFQATEIDDWLPLGEKLNKVQKCMLIAYSVPIDPLVLENELRAALSERIEISHSAAGVLEVMPAGTSKGKALVEVSQDLGIGLESILAFGDGNNDIDMLTTAGFGVALANASTHAKASADLLVPPVDQNGPAQFLDYLLSNN